MSCFAGGIRVKVGPFSIKFVFEAGGRQFSLRNQFAEKVDLTGIVCLCRTFLVLLSVIRHSLFPTEKPAFETGHNHSKFHDLFLELRLNLFHRLSASGHVVESILRLGDITFALGDLLPELLELFGMGTPIGPRDLVSTTIGAFPDSSCELGDASRAQRSRPLPGPPVRRGLP